MNGQLLELSHLRRRGFVTCLVCHGDHHLTECECFGGFGVYPRLANSTLETGVQLGQAVEAWLEQGKQLDELERDLDR